MMYTIVYNDLYVFPSSESRVVDKYSVELIQIVEIMAMKSILSSCTFEFSGLISFYHDHLRLLFVKVFEVGVTSLLSKV